MRWGLIMQKLFELIDAQTIIITANTGLTNHIKHQYEHLQHSHMAKTWMTLDCLPLAAWWHRLWEQYLYADIAGNFTLLTQAQELMLWQTIITQSKLTSYYAPSNQLAQTARVAWELMQKWQLNHNYYLNNNQITFLQWAEQFTSVCNSHHFITQSNLIDFLATQIKHNLTIPPKLIGLNLINLTKQEQYFFYQCTQLGHQVIYYHLAPSTKVVAQKIICPDQEHELATIAKWAKTIRANDPKSTAYCIMPNLSNKQATITQILNTWFDAPCDYKINTQEPLNTQIMIQHALAFLELSRTHIPVTVISIILNSPFIAHNNREFAQLLNLDYQLRQHHYSALAPQDFVKLLDQNHCTSLAQSMKKYYQLRHIQPQTQSLTTWAKIFKKLLYVLNWPGALELDYQEQTILYCWQQFLQEAMKLNNVMQNITYQEALTWLKIFTQETIWNQNINYAHTIAPVLELSDLAAAHGEVCRYLWVSGINHIQDDQLAVTSNPFIPYQCKVKAAEHLNLNHIKTIITSLQSASAQALFAYDPTKPNLLTQEEFIINLPIVADADFNWSSQQSTWEKIFATKKIEPIIENHNLLQAQLTYAHLTPQIMAIQAMCPFKAFAQLHLNAKSVPLLSATLKNTTQERILRYALQRFWQDIPDQQQLLLLSETQLQEKITTCLQQACKKLEPNMPSTIYSQLIITKLSALIRTYLTAEKARPFFRVLHNNKLATIKIGNAILACKIDRIDELAQHQQIIINYTLQQHQISDWLNKRPKSLTLPAALLCKQDNCSGIAWAQLKSNRLLGLSKDPTCIPGIETFTLKSSTNATTWEEQAAWWHNILVDLGEAIINGTAVNPQASSMCRKCNLPTLCRIHSTP